MTDSPVKWRMVPCEPTEAMLDASMGVLVDTECDCMTTTLNDDEATDIYRAMLAASPAPGLEGLRERVARVMVDRTGAGTLGLTDEASMTAARPIAAEIVALIFTPEPKS